MFGNGAWGIGDTPVSGPVADLKKNTSAVHKTFMIIGESRIPQRRGRQPLRPRHQSIFFRNFPKNRMKVLLYFNDPFTHGQKISKIYQQP